MTGAQCEGRVGAEAPSLSRRPKAPFPAQSPGQACGNGDGDTEGLLGGMVPAGRCLEAREAGPESPGDEDRARTLKG